MGVLGGVEIIEGEGKLGVNVGHPIVTNGDFCVVVRKCVISRVRGSDTVLPKLLQGGLVTFVIDYVILFSSTFDGIEQPIMW